MNTIIGQPKLVSIFSNYTFQTMPATIMLVGPTGSGKHFITKRLAEKLNVDFVELTNKTTAEELVDYSCSPVPKLCWLDLTGVTEKAQNKFLKFIEEPSATTRVVIGVEAEVGILPTILNRCVKYILEEYSVDELQKFSWSPQQADNIIYQFCNTPGALLNLGNPDIFEAIYRECEFIIDQFTQMPDSNYAMAMSFCTDISCKENSVNKFDFELFLKVLAHVASDRWRATNNLFAYEAYLIIAKKRQAALNKAVAKEAFIFSLLNELWEKSRYDFSRA